MTEEQKIYKHIKQKHRIYKSHGKYGISYCNLYCAICDAGYNKEVINQIIHNMIHKGYIRLSKDRANKGLKYIIEKWEN